MNKYYVLCFVLNIFLFNDATGALLRARRQTNGSGSPDTGDNVEDRYGFQGNQQGFNGQLPNQFDYPYPHYDPFFNPHGQVDPMFNQGRLPFPHDLYPFNEGRYPIPQPNPGFQLRDPAQEQSPTRDSTSAPAITTSASTNNSERCIQTCPRTSEFNPTCGSNGVTYNNPGHLSCAQSCGVAVTLLRQAPCPAAAATSTTEAATS